MRLIRFPCAQCGDDTLHKAGICVHCGTAAKLPSDHRHEAFKRHQRRVRRVYAESGKLGGYVRLIGEQSADREGKRAAARKDVRPVKLPSYIGKGALALKGRGLRNS